MKFVNIHGQEIDLGAAAQAKRKPSSRAGADSYHKGWLAVGYSPEQIAEGKRQHELLRASAGSKPVPEWSESWFFRHNRPLRIRHKPYEVREAAVQAVALAERSGWKGCHVVALSKS